jgi:hypothetical protein
MPAPTESFGLLHVLGLAAMGCLAFAVFTDEWIWAGIAVIVAIALASWAYILARRQYGGED